MLFKSLSETRNDFSRNIKEFVNTNPEFQRTPQTNTFNVKYYGGTKSNFDNIKSIINDDLNKSDTYSLYLHYPYCKYVCDYCHYPVFKFTKENKNYEIINSLIQHYNLLIKNFPNLKAKSISSFYIGGGTPSLLSVDNLMNLKNLLLDKISFDKTAELSIEATPDSLNEEFLIQLIEIGFNRISIGVQILDNETLKRLGRDHNMEQALAVIEKLKKYKELKTNIDLIYGLPSVSSEKFLGDVSTLANSGIDSITLYRLRLGRIDERKAVLFYDYSKYPEKYPSQEETLIQNIASRRFLKENEFNEEPLGWFNRGKESSRCYNDRWLKQTPMFGLGLSAYSYGTNWQFANKNLLNGLMIDINNDIIPFHEGIILNDEESFLRKCAFNLRYNGSLDRRIIDPKYFEHTNGIYSELSNLHLGNIQDSLFILNDLGKAFIDEIIDNYFQKSKSYFENRNGK